MLFNLETTDQGVGCQVLMNNAGVSGCDWRVVMDINLVGLVTGKSSFRSQNFPKCQKEYVKKICHVPVYKVLFF